MNQNERELLFGILAIQVDLLTQEQLVAARIEWAEQTDKSLGGILVGQGAITTKQEEALSALVDVHLEAHGDRSLLAAAKSKNDMLSSFSRMPSAEDAESITQAGDDMPTLAAGKVGGGGARPTGHSSRFRLLRLHDEGGLGRVYVAHDDELDRTVALKEIKETLADDVGSQSRFILEAEITGGLEHPGIVPVYAFGRYRDERPFYAMRFIRGGSLRQAIREYHEQRSKGDNNPLSMRRLIRRFVDVCNVMTYAHQRGVLHRDLKPNNVMLGQHGETLVVDWGLAKTLGDERTDSKTDLSDRSSPHTALVPRSGSTFDDTVLGKAIGSPPYMSPEQARGEHDQLGPSTDIYSLGGILYSILTNRPPIEAETLADVLEKSRAGAIDSPRSVVADVPKALASITMKALSLEPEERYPSVEALIQDVEKYLADEPVSAHRESFGERLSRIGRRHRTLVRTAALVLLATTIVSMLAAFSLNRQRELTQREKTRGDRVLEHMVEVFRRPDPQVDGRTVTVADVLDRAIEDAKENLTDEPLAKASILQAIGETYDGLGLHQDSLEPLQLAFDIRRTHLGDRHAETLQSEFNIASAHLGLRDSQESIGRFKGVLERQRETLEKDDPAITATELSLAYAYVVAGEPERAIEIYKSSVEKLEASAPKSTDDHESITSMMSGLAYAYSASGDNKEAAAQIDRSIEYATLNLGARHALTLAALHLKAKVLHDLGKKKEAISASEAAYQGRMEVLGESHGDTLSTANDLAVLYFKDKRFEDATDLLEEVCRSRSEKFGESHIYTRTTLWNLASMYGTVNKPEKAAATLQRVADTLSTADELKESVHVLNKLVIAYELAGDRSGAKSTYLQIVETAGIEEEELIRALRGVTHHSMGRKEYEDALTAATRWVELTADSDPEKALICLAEAQLGLGETEEAHRSLASAKAFIETPSAYFQHLQAIVLAERGERDEAEAILRKTYPDIVDSNLTIKVSYRKEAARRRIDQFYEQWGRPEKTNNWRTERDALAE